MEHTRDASESQGEPEKRHVPRSAKAKILYDYNVQRSAVWLATPTNAKVVGHDRRPDTASTQVPARAAKRVRLSEDQSALALLERVPLDELVKKIEQADLAGKYTLRPYQIQALQAFKEDGKSVFVHAATGSGKSLLFEGLRHVPELIIAIISPLNKLQDEQARTLIAGGASAACFHSEALRADPQLVSRAAAGLYRYLLVSPEFLERAEARKILTSSKVASRLAAFFIDEAHLVSEWARSFRPAFNNLRTLADLLPGVPFMCMSGTMPQHVMRKVQHSLAIPNDDLLVVRANVSRPNLHISVRPTLAEKGNEMSDVWAAIIQNANQPITTVNEVPLTILYVDSHELLEAFTAQLRAILPLPLRSSVYSFSSRGRQATRDATWDDIIQGSCRIIVATECLGMVRLIAYGVQLHFRLHLAEFYTIKRAWTSRELLS